MLVGFNMVALADERGLFSPAVDAIGKIRAEIFRNAL